MFNPIEQRDKARAFFVRAAKAEDAGEPLKSLEIATNEDSMQAVQASQVFGMIRVDDVSDEISVTTAGRMFAGLRLADAPDLGTDRVNELRGDMRESELMARYVEGKIAGAERLIKNGSDPEKMRWLTRVLIELANEIRQDFHVPTVLIFGRVIPYNQDNETGIKHAANLALFFSDVHERNRRAGWWTDLETGEPKKRSVGELFMLFITEIAEAYEAYVRNQSDDKLPHYPGLGVELGDLGIRLADFAGAAMGGYLVEYSGVRNPGDELFEEVLAIASRYEKIRKTPEAIGDPEQGQPLPPMDIPAMIDEKLAYNAKRADHKIENRLKDDGKKT